METSVPFFFTNHFLQKEEKAINTIFGGEKKEKGRWAGRWERRKGSHRSDVFLDEACDGGCGVRVARADLLREDGQATDDGLRVRRQLRQRARVVLHLLPHGCEACVFCGFLFVSAAATPLLVVLCAAAVVPARLPPPVFAALKWWR